MITGTLLRKTRVELGLSQYKLAKHSGISQYRISAFELGKEKLNEEELRLINETIQQLDGKIPSIKKKKVQQHTYKLSNNSVDTHIRTLPKTAKDAAGKGLNYRNGNSDMKAIALFSGLGGFSIGVHDAGFDVIGHVELQDGIRDIYEYNFPDSVNYGNDITQISDEFISSIKEEQGEIDLLFGGPPCQGFSLAGKRNVFDPRNQLYNYYVKWARILKPRAFILENVKTLTTMETPSGSLLLNHLVNSFKEIGYTLNFQVINAADYGVPQSRERFVLLGVRNDVLGDKSLCFPTKTHAFVVAKTPLFPIKMEPYKSFRDATCDLESLESGDISHTDIWHFAIKHPDHVIDMLKDVPEGKSAHENTNPEKRPSSGYNTTYKRIVWDEPSSTISTNFSMISGSRNVHPKNTRALTIREAMRCQTFPDDFALFGSLGDIRTGIGNAVPVQLGKFLASHIKTNYLDDKSSLPSD